MYQVLHEDCIRCENEEYKDAILVASGLLEFWGKRVFKIAKTGKDYSGRDSRNRDRYEKIIHVSNRMKAHWERPLPLLWIPENDVRKWIESLEELAAEGKKASADNINWGRYDEIELLNREIRDEVDSYWSIMNDAPKEIKLQKLREEIHAPAEITKLDRYRALLSAMFVSITGVIGYFLANISSFLGAESQAFIVYSQTILSMIFLAVYGIGWAKNALDIRILGTASFFQFLYLLLVLLMAFFGYSNLVQILPATGDLSLFILGCFGLLIFILMAISPRIGRLTALLLFRRVVPKEKSNAQYGKMTYLVRWAMPRIVFHLSVLSLFFIFQYPQLIIFPQIQLLIVVPFAVVLIEWRWQMSKAQTRFLEGSRKSVPVQNQILCAVVWIVMLLGFLWWGSSFLLDNSEPLPLLFMMIIVNLAMLGILGDAFNSSFTDIDLDSFRLS
ncbi:MAG: hypothetical protein ACXADD_15100 [Candidatus Thorarchaeota archaeon]|jgi:hypothetical protein